MLAQLLFEWTGYSLFNHRLFRAGAAAIFASSMIFILMPIFISFLTKLNATSDFDEAIKKSPPIMGGVLVVAIVSLATFCFSNLNGYVGSILIIMIAYCVVGGIDDVMKIRTKRLIDAGKMDKGSYQAKADGLSPRVRLLLYFIFSLAVAGFAYKFIPNMDGHLTVPFIKKEIWFPYLPNWAFILLISFVITSTANGANFTDGLDTLVSVPLITSACFIGIVAYVSGNFDLSEYFLIPNIPGVDELFPICTAIVGGLLAYLWFNSPPAQIYMGDGGSIGLGGAIGMMFVLVKAELFLPIIGIIFLMEAFSVLTQIAFFKLTRKIEGEGRRIFRRAPIHDHFILGFMDQGLNRNEAVSKTVWRFHLISLFALIIGTLIFFKVR